MTSPAASARVATAPSLAKANTTKTNGWVEVVDAPVTDPCSGDEIIFNGKIHTVTTVTENSDGTGQASTHLNYASISGFGLTGLKYNIVATAKQEEITNTVGYAGRQQQQVQLVSQGSADNYKGHAVVEYEWDGFTYTSVTIRMRESCK